MPRGAEYDNGIPQSDNAIENGPNKAHGVGADVRPTLPNSSRNPYLTPQQNGPLDRKVAPMPEETGSDRDVYSGTGAPGHSSGKGGHEPKTLGEKKGLGSLPGQ